MNKILFPIITLLIFISSNAVFSQKLDIITREIGFGSERTSSISYADIDNDGDLDILGNSGSTIQWHENDGTGSSFQQKELAKLTTYEEWGNLYGSSNFAMEDIDNDGDLDIVSASNVGDAISWYENTGGGTTPSYTEGSILIEGDFGGARRVLMSDFDGDGDIDIAGGAYYGKGGNEDNRRLIIFDNQPTERTQ